MKMQPLLLATALLAACSSPPDTPTVAQPAPTSAPTGDVPASTIASARGVVEAVDTEAKTITIAHGPVEALKWPAMTMDFQAPDIDLTSIKQGDRIVFEFAATGMKAKITKLTRQE